MRCNPSRRIFPVVVSLVLLLGAESCAWTDKSPHKLHFVTVDGTVKLEVLDWGGSGRPIVLLAGLGNTAHVFDDFAPRLSAFFHVYGITRRGYGASSAPTSGYDAYRLGDDVVAVLDSFRLSNPIVAGHSIAGSELSSVAFRHRDRVAGLIYLDAIFPYAFDNGKATTMEEWLEVTKMLPQPPAPGVADLTSFQSLQTFMVRWTGIKFPEAELRQTMSAPDGRPGEHRTSHHVADAVMEGIKKFAGISVAVLAISAIPADMGPLVEVGDDAVKTAASKAADLQEKQVNAFEVAVPSARVVRLSHANHYVFLSNEKDVLREMSAFAATVK